MKKECSPQFLLELASKLADAAARFEALGNSLKAEGLPPIRLEIASRVRCTNNLHKYGKRLKGLLEIHRDEVEAQRLGEADREAEDKNL